MEKLTDSKFWGKDFVRLKNNYTTEKLSSQALKKSHTLHISRKLVAVAHLFPQSEKYRPVFSVLTSKESYLQLYDTGQTGLYL